MKNGDSSTSKGKAGAVVAAGRNSAVVSPKDLKDALSLINEFVFKESENAKEEKLRDVAEHIKRTARRLFAIARAIEDVLPDDQR